MAEPMSFVDARFADRVYAYRTPGYPLLVAILNGDLRAIRIAQALIDTSTVLAVFLLAGRWLARPGALLVSAIVALNPFLVYFCGLILSETLFTAMLAWGMTLLILRTEAASAVRFPRGVAWFAGLAILALSILVRPSAIGLPLLLSVVAAFVNRDRKLPYDRRWMPPVGTLALLVTLIVLLPWAWRNYRVVGAWVFTTTNGGITLYDGLHPDATGASDQRFVRSMPQLRGMNEVARSSYLADAAWRFVREHPRRALELAGIKIARTWSPVPLSAEYGRDRRTLVAAAVYMIPLYVAVVLGLWFAPASRSIKVYLMAPAVYFTIVHAVSVGSLRYRIPSDVPMAVIAGLAAQAWWLRARRERAPVETQEIDLENDRVAQHRIE